MKKFLKSRLHYPVNLLQIVMLIGFFMLQFSCSFSYSPEKYLKEYDAFVTYAENDFPQYNDAEWDSTIREYNHFNTELYNRVYSNLTPEHQQAIGKFKARFELVRLKYELNSTMQGVKDGIEQLKGVIKE